MTKCSDHVSLFNDERFLRCNLKPGDRLFRYDHTVEGRLIGSLTGVIVDEVLECGHSAPFGGLDLVRQQEDVGNVVGLISGAREAAQRMGAREILIRARPDYFGDNEAPAAFALLNLGARVESCELTLGIRTKWLRSADEYLAALGEAPLRLVRQGIRAGLVFEAVASPDDWAHCYDLLSEVKQRRGVTLKVSLDYVLGLRAIFGDRIAMYRVLSSGKTAAAALVYRVSPDWDYLVAWGDRLEYRHQRPMNFMAYSLSAVAISEGLAGLELGISSVEGRADAGLVKFKRRVGGVTGLRTNYRLPSAPEKLSNV
jgi:Acetyltransferase (GNAT) domain